MIKGIIGGTFIGFLMTYLGADSTFIEVVQPYVTFEVTAMVYYIFAAILGCIFIKG